MTEQALVVEDATAAPETVVLEPVFPPWGSCPLERFVTRCFAG